LKLAESDPLPLRMDRLAEHLHDLEEQAIPIGLHRIGEIPSHGALRDAAAAFLSNSATPKTKAEIGANASSWAAALLDGGTATIAASEACRAAIADAEQWLNNIRSSPAAELANLIAVLNGRHIPSGESGDPLRAAGALPTGRNLHDQDPRGFPSKAFWAAGEQLAKELLQSYERKHAVPPKRVSFVPGMARAEEHRSSRRPRPWRCWASAPCGTAAARWLTSSCFPPRNWDGRAWMWC
jgi:cobaltochelatase CobN